jgi:histidinol phosphatase-like PHP family hydrolase
MSTSFVDFHTHTIFSDGELLPAELVQRASEKGCRGIAITDHADSSNLEFVVSRVAAFATELGEEWAAQVIPGVELTHVPPRRIPQLAERARALGARWVVVHGETVTEPVAAGTNRAAIEAGVDLLAHPGLIHEEDASLAAEVGVFLEVTTRKGHSLTNGWVVQRAMETGARLLLDTDTHGPQDILDGAQRRMVALGAGLSPEGWDRLVADALQLLKRLRGEEGGG